VSIKIEIVDTIDGFISLEEAWDLLYEDNSNVTVFLSWDWMYTWWEVYHNSISSQLFILCAYENNELIG